MVAKTYQNYEKIGEPFQKSNKMYINVRLNSGKIKAVRVYTPKEYEKLYPGDKKAVAEAKERKTQREVLGFGEKGYIYLYEGDTMYIEHNTPARECVWWGWYYPDLIPDLPQNIRVYTLNWDAVGNPNGSVDKEKAKYYRKERKLLNV